MLKLTTSYNLIKSQIKGDTFFFCILFTLACIGTLFINSIYLIEPDISPKRYAGMLCILMGLIYYSIKKGWFSIRKENLEHNLNIFVLIIIVSCIIQALFGIFQFINTKSYNSLTVTGSFDNPAGFSASLCVGLPFILLYIKNNKILSCVVLFINSLAIFLSGSRTGIVCILAMCFVCFFKYSKITYWIKWAIIFISLFASLTILYFIKKDSADGRLLIWHCSYEMIRDKPLFGHGKNSFQAHYMDYQSSYFRNNPESKYSILADNVTKPFNEYLTVVLNYGFIGLILLLLIVAFILYCFSINPQNRYNQVSLLSLFLLSILSCFSYPFFYPFIWIMVVFNVIIIVNNASIILHSLKKYKKAFCFTLLLLGSLHVVNLGEKFFAEIEWAEISDLSLSGETQEMIPRYEKLENDLKQNAYFLYNYTMELYTLNLNKESIMSAKI